MPLLKHPSINLESPQRRLQQENPTKNGILAKQIIKLTKVSLAFCYHYEVTKRRFHINKGSDKRMAKQHPLPLRHNRI